METLADKIRADASFEANAEARERESLCRMVQKAHADCAEMAELLADIREWLDGQQDAETIDGMTIGNQQMKFCSQIDALIGEYT